MVFQINIKLFRFNLIIVFYLNFLLDSIKNNCLKEKPIKINDLCKLEYCPKEKFISGECVIDNEIIKIQWLNNIIKIGDLNFRYINFATYSNGDMIVETDACPGNDQRMFYGIKSNGRAFFNEESGSKKTNYFLLQVIDNTIEEKYKYKFEAENFIITINEGENKGKEYLMGVPKGDLYGEIYFFDERNIKRKPTQNIFGEQMKNIRNPSINYFSNNKNYTVLGYKSIENSNNVFKLKKIYFKDKVFPEQNPLITEFKTYANIGSSLSCFITEAKNFICTYLEAPSNAQVSLCIIVISENFVQKYYGCFSDYMTSNPLSFIKCVHIKQESGIFIYYNSFNHPILLIKNYVISNGIAQFEEFFTNIPYIELKSYYLNGIYFNDYCLKNDLIKINENKFCFITSSSTNDTLYISLINFIEKKNVVIRYYLINIYKLYNYKFLFDIRGHLYNKFIALGFSYCNAEKCNDDKNDAHYSAFLLFSYPNRNDLKLDIFEYLYENNEIVIYNLIIDMEQNAKIDNNIFGYVYYGINIKENQCDNIDIYSYNTNAKINLNQKLETEKVILKYKNTTYQNLSCIIKYSYVYTDPNFDNYSKYVDIEDTSYGQFNKATYNNQKDLYEGKTIYYNIKIEKYLFTEYKNSELYLKNDSCIIYKYDFEYEIGNTNKICFIPQKEEEKKEEEEEEEEKGKKEEEEEERKEIQRVEEEEKKEEEEEKEEVKEEEKKIEEEKGKKEQEEKEEEIKKVEEKEEEQQNSEKKEEDENQIIPESEEEKNKEEKEINEIEETETKSELIENDNTIDLNSKTCTNVQIIENKCGNGTMRNEQIGIIFNHIIENILKNEDYNNENTIIKTENVVFQLSTFEDQKDNLDPSISTIDLGKCESLLKTENGITEEDSLLIIKTDIKNEDLTSTYVQYEIYHPYELEPLNLDVCKKEKIVVNTPISLKEETLNLYDTLSEDGYNLFDSRDDFYNDICATYTSESGTDMTLEDRKKEIYNTNSNITICQIGCAFELYNKTTKKSKCNCDIQKEKTQIDITRINFNKNFIEDKFISTLKNSNFHVLKCYKLVLNLNNLAINKGRILMTIIMIFFFLLIIIYCAKDRKNISLKIQAILKAKINDFNNRKDSKKETFKSKNNSKRSSSNLNNKKKNSFKAKSKIEMIKKNNKDDKNNKKKNNKVKNINQPPKRKIEKKFSSRTKKKNLSLNTQKHNLINRPLQKKKSSKSQKININIMPINNISYGKIKKNNTKIIKNNIHIYKPINSDVKNLEFNLINKSKINLVNPNDEELNSLEYELAIIFDKRTYFQYYWSLLKKKQLILFTFLPANDYNLFSIKLSLFLLSFSLYFTINGFFFSDKTMHKIHEAKGSFNIFFQIPQILYSSIISSVIHMILRELSLSEKSILLIKQEKNPLLASKKSRRIERCITLKFIIFFCLGILLLVFFWYFISCFCAVYINTQMILITDTLISFGFSMLYPFGTNLIPGFFRIPSLRAKKKDSKYLYKISRILSLFV